jgi:hypothetical protein
MEKNTNQARFDFKNQTIKFLLFIAIGIGLSVSSIKATEPFSIQQATITGKITAAENDSALVGVRVQVMYLADPTVKPVLSQKDGTYSLNVPEGAKTILFSLYGYETLIVDIVERKVINVVLTKQEEDPSMWKDLLIN